MDAKYCECQKVLLNLKWFVKHLCRVFEDRLQRSVTTTSNHHNNHHDYHHNMSPSNRSTTATTNNKDEEDNRSSYTSSQCSSPVPPIKTSCASLNTQSLKTCENGTPTKTANNSTALSPLHNKAVNKKWSNSPTRYSLTNSPLLRRFVKVVPPLITGTPTRKTLSYNQRKDPRKARLVLLAATTTESEREVYMKRFGEHIAVVYEYQIGMLENLCGVNLLASFVACIVLKLIRNGEIDSLHPDSLNLSYLLQHRYYPRSFLGKSVKTVSIGLSQNFLSWSLKHLFSHPGLRYNHVGGENCSNLTIVTQLLCGRTASGEQCRPDLFGYRNLICHRAAANNTSSSSSSYYKADVNDEVTIRDLHTSDSLIKTSAESLMDHLHKCYKSIFFVVLDRTLIIDHLLTCHSFKTFCLRELITPVLFVNIHDDGIASNNDKRLFQNFNLFHISVTSKPLHNSANNSATTSASAATTTGGGGQSAPANCSKESEKDGENDEDDKSSYCSECRILSKVYDNHAFMC